MSASESVECLNYKGTSRNVVDFDMQEAPRGGSSQSTSATVRGFVKPKGRSPSGEREMKLVWMDEPAVVRICCWDLTSMGGVAKFCTKPIVPGQSFCTLLSHGSKDKLIVDFPAWFVMVPGKGRGGVAALTDKSIKDNEVPEEGRQVLKTEAKPASA
jgi:hypothetical protein